MQNVFGLVHAVLWVATPATVDLVFSASPARGGYGLLCAWWVTLYVALRDNGPQKQSVISEFVLLLVVTVPLPRLRIGRRLFSQELQLGEHFVCA